MGLFDRADKLTANDLKNILLWYERMNMERDEQFTPAKDSLYKEILHWKRDSFWERKFDKI